MNVREAVSTRPIHCPLLLVVSAMRTLFDVKQENKLCFYSGLFRHTKHFFVWLVGGRRRINPFPNNKFLDSSKLKEIADDNFKLYKNGRKFSKRVENTVGK